MVIFGKWYLGMEVWYNLIYYGFDEFVGYFNGVVDYYVYCDWYNGFEWEEIEGYIMYLIMDYLICFIKVNSDCFFFLYVFYEVVYLLF